VERQMRNRIEEKGLLPRTVCPQEGMVIKHDKESQKREERVRERSQRVKEQSQPTQQFKRDHNS